MKTKTSLLAASALALCLGTTSAQAAQPGWYFGIEAGASWVEKPKMVETFQFLGGPAFTFPLDVDIDSGWAIVGAAGYDWGSWRAEGEITYRDNAMSLPCCWLSPSLKEVSLMGNVLYDISLAHNVTISFGAGIGADHGDFTTGDVYFSDGDWRFAYQAIATLAYALSERADLTVTYRFLNVSEPTFATTSYGRFVSDSYDDLHKHSVTVGIRYRFAPSEPAPRPLSDAAFITDAVLF